MDKEPGIRNRQIPHEKRIGVRSNEIEHIPVGIDFSRLRLQTDSSGAFRIILEKNQSHELHAVMARTPNEDDLGRGPGPTLVERIIWKVMLKSIKILVSVWVFITQNIKKRPVDQRPTYTKKYAMRPGLVNHVWIPPTYKAGDAPLPLLIDIHGGGFCIGHPFVNDRDNALFCHKYGICVVSINYRKAPDHKFPTAVEDVAALIQAVLDDPELPADKSKVALIGYSAGGNLALTAPQLNGLHAKIKGVVAYYPVTDFERSLEMRMSVAIPPPGREDILVKMSRAFNWSYIRTNNDFTNPLMSPLFCPRDKLAPKMFILGCEYDLLFAEAKDAAEKYASYQDGQKQVELGGERTGWTCGGVTWEELKGLEHGFNQRWEHEKDPVIKAKWKQAMEENHEKVAKWLFKEVYSTQERHRTPM